MPEGDHGCNASVHEIDAYNRRVRDQATQASHNASINKRLKKLERKGTKKK